VAGSRRPRPDEAAPTETGPGPSADTSTGTSADTGTGTGTNATHRRPGVIPPRWKGRRTRSRGRRHTVLVPALAAGLALVVLAAVLVHALRPALTPGDRQAAVSSARTSLETLLSYSADRFDEHVAQVTPRLTSPFREEFTKVAASDVKPLAVDNGATVRATVYDAGVMDVTGDGSAGSTVRVMAFVNQATSTKKQPQPAIDQNRVIATMTKVGDRWLVSSLDAF
jgi:Mce-associated membrane protein